MTQPNDPRGKGPRTGPRSGDMARTEIDPGFRGQRPAPAANPNQHARTQISGAPQMSPQPSATPARTAITGPPPMGAPDRASLGTAPTMATPAPNTPAPATSNDGFGASLALSQGIRVAQFELIRELGRGGMGQVFLARDTKLGRLVALKFLALRSAELTERFLIEARATARCNHENIVVIYEADEWEGQPYMALEFLEGQPLSEERGKTTLSARRAIEIMVPVVRALERAHHFDIVHRDLKPDNIFVTSAGVVKVLDFGIAKLFTEGQAPAAMPSAGEVASMSRSNMTQQGRIVGTMPYMAPEQWGADTIDHRADLWAVGIIFWELLTGRHPLDPLSPQKLSHAAAMLDTPMPRIGEAVHDLPPALEPIIDRCLAKRKDQRFSSARELLDALEPLLPGRFGRRLEAGESPYPGMTAFQESDADRFFGRSKDITHMVQRMREQPLVGVVGTSGVGKSSFIRAGVVPALRASGESWEVLITRPGRTPLEGLASLLQPMMSTSSADINVKMAEHKALVDKLRAEPGYLGTLLRSRARQKRGQILLFVDQFEELYTLVDDPAERRAFTACLSGVADDASTPLRAVVSMRSDFLDRAAEDRGFMERLTRGLLFLPEIDRDGMREALVEPLEMVNHSFESNHVIEDMLNSLADSQGALPLLQFTAAKLWDARDRQRRLLTDASYEALGGLGGALATHADDVLNGLAPNHQRLVKTLFLRLITSDGTRAVVEVSELRQLGDPHEIQSLLDHLVAARLLVVQSRGDEGAAVEIVHESLTHSWPTLRRWLDESSEDNAFLEQLRAAAKQWDSRGRAAGLLWRGDAMDEARRFNRRFQGELPAREREYLDAVIDLATRATRRKRRLVVGAFTILLGMVAAAAVALVMIRGAEQKAQKERRVAQEQKKLAETEAERVRKARAQIQKQLTTITEQMDTIKRKEKEVGVATAKADEAEKKAKTGEKKLAMTYDELEKALKRAKKEQRKAESERARAEKERRKAERAAKENVKLAEAEKKAKKKAQRLLAKEKARVRRLEKEKRKLSTKLK